MAIRTQLLVAFASVVLLSLGMFGAVAYWVIPDAATSADALLLHQLSRELGTHLSRPASNGGLNDRILDALRRRLTGSETTVLVQGRRGQVLAVSSAGSTVERVSHRRLLEAARHAEAKTRRRHGVLQVGSARYNWASSAIAGTPDVVTVMHPLSPEYARYSRILWMRLGATALFVMWSAVWAALVMSSVIARRLDEKNAALTHQAHHDSLTGFPNRTLLHQQLTVLIQDARRLARPLALFVMDLNHFKDVNDTLGHSFGDNLLKLVGLRVNGALNNDTVLARLGGDEFAVALPDTDFKQAVAYALRVLNTLEQPFVIDGVTLDVRTSIGIAMYPEHGEAADVMVQHADTAMYKAKKAAAGYRFYDPDDDPHSLRRLTLAGELRHGIEQSQLVLHYQPKMDLHTGRPIGVEALVRWLHPVHGLVPPDDFIPLAERTGLIRPLTEWVLREAVRQCCLWRRRGCYLSVAVNLSAHNLKHACLPTEIGALLQAWDVPASALVLEITESAMMEDPELATNIVRRLDKMGLRISIDDFGTGYSSLAHLQRLSVHELKVDKSFVMGMSADESNTVIVRSIVDLAHNLGCKVVAEGVANDSALQVLESLGCDVAQGYHISRPLAVEDLDRWLAQTSWGQGTEFGLHVVKPRMG